MSYDKMKQAGFDTVFDKSLLLKQLYECENIQVFEDNMLIHNEALNAAMLPVNEPELNKIRIELCRLFTFDRSTKPCKVSFQLCSLHLIMHSRYGYTSIYRIGNKDNDKMNDDEFWTWLCVLTSGYGEYIDPDYCIQRDLYSRDYMIARVNKIKYGLKKTSIPPDITSADVIPLIDEYERVINSTKN